MLTLMSSWEVKAILWRFCWPPFGFEVVGHYCPNVSLVINKTPFCSHGLDDFPIELPHIFYVNMKVIIDMDSNMMIEEACPP